jgi:sugar (pentulose or hexulose) kinase
VKDEALLPMEDWKRTWRILPHGALATGYLTGNFDVVSISSAASTGIMDLQTGEWRRQMLAALESPAYRRLAWQQLPGIQDYREPVGRLSSSLALALGIRGVRRPYLFPSSDDQQAGLVGGGAVDDGHVAIILGNSAVVNSSSAKLPTSTNLDVMRLSWGPYLLMRCYNNGAQFLDAVVGPRPNWKELEAAARACHPGCDGVQVLPFLQPEPSLAVHQPVVRWIPSVPDSVGARYRVALESLAYMIAKGVAEHKAAGQNITRVTVSGGIARGNLMCEILASVLNRPLERLKSDEGPALGAAVLALTGMADQLGRTRKNAPRFELPDAVRQLVRFGTPVQPNGKWQEAYRSGFNSFCRHLPER